VKFPDRVEAKTTVMMGKPCVKGTRIPVYLLLEKMAAGEGFERLLGAYPQLTSDDLRACLAYAAALAAEEVVLSEARDFRWTKTCRHSMRGRFAAWDTMQSP
jgi:uncharacterized protein (DUF433 family)